MPPARFFTLAKPAWRSRVTALALRTPLRQWATISRLESSSFMRAGSIAQRDEIPADVADLIFVRLAHIEDEDVVASVESGFQFLGLNFRHGCSHRASWLSLPRMPQNSL